MRRASLLLCAAALAGSLGGQGQQAAPPSAASANNPLIRLTTQEVLLDLVVRDKRGRTLRDLAAGEIEVFEDGQKQPVRSFRLVTGGDLAGPETQRGPAAPTASPVRSFNPLRQVRVVTLAFERLGPDGRALARQAALDLLRNPIGPNEFVGVFNVDQRLAILQQYTNDLDAVKQAVDKATSANYSLYAEDSARIAGDLRGVSQMDQMDAASMAASASGAPSAGQMGAMVAAQMARMTLNMLQFSQMLDRAQQAQSSIYSLAALIREQSRLPGRKTLLFFTEGLNVPPNMTDQFRNIISTANRANVSVYAVDAKGLLTAARNTSSGAMLQQATRAIQAQQTTGSRGGAVSPEQARAIDMAEESLRANVENNLQELAEETGGMLISNTNDLRLPLRQVSEDIGTYYELSYSPSSERFDGKFRRILVKVARPDVKVQTRSGYYAVPTLGGETLLPFEVALLNALSSTPPPRAVSYRSAAIPYVSKAGAQAASVVIDVPLDQIQFRKEAEKGVYSAHFSVMAIVKSQSGEIITKFSRDVPTQGPLANLEAVRASRFIYTQRTELPPGRYTLETSVLDRAAEKAGAKRQALVVAPRKGLSMSGLAFVRSMNRAEAHPADVLDDPFEVPAGRITPGLDDTVKAGKDAALALYFTLYSDQRSTEPTVLAIEFLQDGKPVARAEPQLPPADEHGRIPYIANSSLGSLKPGQYEIRVTARQGVAAVQDHTYITVVE